MMKAFILFSLLIVLLQNVWAEDEAAPTKIGPTCVFGSNFELDLFFARENLVQVAKGTRTSLHNVKHDEVEVLFFVSTDMNYFHVVTKKVEHGERFRACIISSAREIDFQLDPPVQNLLLRKPREHLLFLNDLPKEGQCPPEKNNCTPWGGPSHFIGTKFLLTAYLYSEHWELDSYTQIVDLKLDHKIIQPTRGMLSEFARIKYASRLRNELNEAPVEVKDAKEAYREIYTEVDHGHPLYTFIIEDNGDWKITMVDRHRGIVWTPIEGKDLEIYPLSKREYRDLRDN